MKGDLEETHSAVQIAQVAMGGLVMIAALVLLGLGMISGGVAFWAFLAGFLVAA